MGPEAIAAQLVPAWSSCDDLDYGDEAAAIAFAFLHMGERYRRTWQTLVELLDRRSLPAPAFGVNFLDVGSGTAPSIYAVQDFYSDIERFAAARSVRTEPYRASATAVESGMAMAQLMHLISEQRLSRTSTFGPFQPSFRDFASLDLRQSASEAREDFEHPAHDGLGVDDDYGGAAARHLDSTARAASDRRFSFGLCGFCNVITTAEQLTRWTPELERLLDHVTPGAVVFVMCGRGGEYPAILQGLDGLAFTRGWVSVAMPDVLLSSHVDEDAQIIRAFQQKFWALLETDSAAQKILEESKQRLYAEHIWNPSYVATGDSKFAVRAYRKPGSSELSSSVSNSP